MTAIRAIFDGKVFVPEQPVDIPVGTAADVVVAPKMDRAKTPHETADKSSSPLTRKPLAELAAILDALPNESDLPPDASINIKHYLYGYPKRTE
jgi:hypothetical protein